MMKRAARRTRTRVVRLTRRGWLVLAIGAVAVVVAYTAGRAELVPLGSFLIVLTAAAWLYVRLRPVRFSAARQFTPAVIAAGRTSEVILEIANLARFQSPVANWRDTWPWPPFVTAVQPLPALAAGEARRTARGSAIRLGYSFTPSRRGLFTIGPVIVDFSDPFGLADGASVVEGTADLTVTPAIVRLSQGTVAIAADEGATRMRQRRSFGGEDDLMTREYQQGDAMRRVHWRASAHHGELMVRQEEQRSHAEARLVLDTVRSGYSDSRGVGSIDEAESAAFEWAVSLCTSLSLYLSDRGFVVQVTETGEKQLAPLDQIDEYLESLAAVQLTSRSVDRMSLLRAGARPDRPQGSVFAVLASGISSALVDRLASQRKSFDLAVAFVVDGGFVGSTPSPLMQRLRAAGWICVAATPSMSIEEVWLAVGAEQESTYGSR